MLKSILKCLLSTIFALLCAPPLVISAQENHLVIPLWSKGAPGFENRRNEPEQAKDYWVKNIHNPSITVYLPPKEKATGAAVIICPGGGHRLLVFNAEGVEPAVFLNSIGVAAFVLKYRLGRDTNSPYQVARHPMEDAYRAIRTVRSRAGEWNLDPKRIGIMGFSAGGEVVSMVAYGDGNNKKALDAIDKTNGKPNFQILIYPGPLGVPDVIPSDAPPAFLLVANNDQCCSAPVISLLQKFRAAKVPVEAHIYSQGDHAFNMGSRSPFITLKNWPQRMAEWMADNNLLKSSQ
ncbi:MAG: alpha/beta hydrolase [Ginsengibacter sp.]